MNGQSVIRRFLANVIIHNGTHLPLRIVEGTPAKGADVRYPLKSKSLQLTACRIYPFSEEIPATEYYDGAIEITDNPEGAVLTFL